MMSFLCFRGSQVSKSRPGAPVDGTNSSGHRPSLATSSQSKTQPPQITSEDVDFLTERVHELEVMGGLLADWSPPGAHVESSAYEIARTIFRRAERNVARLAESGEQVDSNLLAYLNRLSDLIWLFGRLIERDAGVDSSLHGHGGCARPHRQQQSMY